MDFKEELRQAVDEAVNRELSGMQHHLRQMFYHGVQYEMNRRQKELKNALTKAKADNTPS